MAPAPYLVTRPNTRMDMLRLRSSQPRRTALGSPHHLPTDDMEICHFQLKLKLIYDRQSVLVSGAHLGPVTNFSFSFKFPSDSCGFVIL
jgi:hypothetical protein